MVLKFTVPRHGVYPRTCLKPNKTGLGKLRPPFFPLSECSHIRVHHHMYFWAVVLTVYIASCNTGKVKGSQAKPALEQHNDAVRISKGSSYITAISILGFVVGFLFLIKWAYVSRRRQNQRDASQSIWRDEFSVSSLPLSGREHSLKSKKYVVRSAFLVGLFGSPSWETRYSAIVDKMSGNRQQFGQGSLATTESRRYKSLSVKSDRNLSMNSTEMHCGTEHRHHVEADKHRLNTFLQTADLPLPSPAMGFDSSVKRSRHSENANSPRITSWKNKIISGKHSSYPSGLWFERQSDGPDTKTQTTFAPLKTSSNGSSSSKVDTVPDSAEYQTGCIPRRSVSNEPDTVLQKPRHANYIKSRLNGDTTGYPSESATLDTAKKGLNVLLSRDLMNLEQHAPLHSMDNQGNLQPASAWVSDVPNSSPFTLIGTTWDASNADYCYSEEKLSVLPAKPHMTVLPAKERVRSRSPKVGPSPLRRMFLPTDDTDFNEPDSGSILSVLMRGRNSSIQYPWEHTFEDLDRSPTNSLAFLETRPKQPRELDVTGLGISQSVVKRSYGMERMQRLAHPKQNQSDGNLLGFLEELVQETSEWDPDMFLDSNFKVMIDSSKSFDVCTPTRARRKKSTPSRRRMSYICLEDIPEADSKGIDLLYLD